MKNVSYYRHLHPESLKKLVAITKITAVSLLTVLPSTMQAEPTYSQSVVISIKTERMLLTDLFSQIEKQSEFLFFYVDKDVADIKVNIKANRTDLYDQRSEYQHYAKSIRTATTGQANHGESPRQ